LALRRWLESLINETLGEPESFPVTLKIWASPRAWKLWPMYASHFDISDTLWIGPFSITRWRGEFAKRPKQLISIF